ncbi:MAG: MFS transporter [Rhodocyclaceae bacterium]|jgi:predicted MFS family arabinose efflux permease|nr:MFS transporter [Rhodocyclaceae bacterium]MBK6555238.1 MFS transporter [Rhodocyclaceae bacterium]MBK9309479.1 MFS transporter [Rhodocyclaceae bacterium]MBK9955429.1 MFS transporter [Rhodocyclaceae bacterium]
MEFTPEQKRRRLLMLLVVVAAYVLSFFQRFAPAGIAQDLAAAFQTTAASLGALAATYFYVYTVMQVPTGILVDTLGARRILLLGGLVAGGGSLMFGMAESLNAALVGRTLVGLGVSVVFIAALKIIAVWYEERRFATVVGVFMLVGNLGSVLAGAPLSWLAQTAGWRGVFTGVGIVSLALGAACWLLVRDRAQPGAGGSGGIGRVDRTMILQGLLTVLRNPATWPAAAVNFGLGGSFFAFGGLWAAPYLMQVHGMSRAIASAHLSMYFAGFAVGCLLLGNLSDRLGRRKAVVLVAAHIYGVIWLVWLSGVLLPPAVTYTLFAVMGVAMASFSLTWACAKEVNPPYLSGMSTSVTNMGGFLGGAVMQPLVGWVMDLRWNGAMADGVRIYAPDDFRMGLALLVAMAWFGVLSAWRIRETRCRNIHAELAAAGAR